MTSTTPAGSDPAPRPKRRTFSPEYELRTVAEYDAAPENENGSVLRRERLYHSHVKEGRAERDAGALEKLVDKRTHRCRRSLACRSGVPLLAVAPRKGGAGRERRRVHRCDRRPVRCGPRLWHTWGEAGSAGGVGDRLPVRVAGERPSVAGHGGDGGEYAAEDHRRRTRGHPAPELATGSSHLTGRGAALRAVAHPRAPGRATARRAVEFGGAVRRSGPAAQSARAAVVSAPYTGGGDRFTAMSRTWDPEADIPCFECFLRDSP